MSSQVKKQNPHKGPRQRFLNKKKFDPDKYVDRNINKEDCIPNCCERCIKCIIWKIDYGKFKPLRTFAKCHKCAERNITLPYHKVCKSCAEKMSLCAKCEMPLSCEEENSAMQDETVDTLELLTLSAESKEKNSNFKGSRSPTPNTASCRINNTSENESDEDEIIS